MHLLLFLVNRNHICIAITLFWLIIWINRKKIITIQILLDLTRFRKDFTACSNRFLKLVHNSLRWRFPEWIWIPGEHSSDDRSDLCPVTCDYSSESLSDACYRQYCICRQYSIFDLYSDNIVYSDNILCSTYILTIL